MSDDTGTGTDGAAATGAGDGPVSGAPAAAGGDDTSASTGDGPGAGRGGGSGPSEPLFALRDVEAGYGRAALVLRGLSLTVEAGQVVCLVGPNGAGKSTVLKVASGLLAPRSGRVLLRGDDVTGSSPQRLLARGVAHVLQGHSVFREMTVEENVRLGGYTLRDPKLVAERCRWVREVFPVVGERWRTTAGLLSGGQQKQVELARALMLEPAVVLLDEPSMGLDPRTTATVFEQIARLRQLGTAVLLVEQNARRALELADVGCVLDLGRVHASGPAADILADPALGTLYLGGSAAARAPGVAGGADPAGGAQQARPPGAPPGPTTTSSATSTTTGA